MTGSAKLSGAPNAIRLGAQTISVSDYASQGNAILGIRDSGKTYTATWLAEQLDAAGVPFIAFDPIGVWRFLRHGKDGVRCVVAGGMHGDLPLTEENVIELVRHAMTARVSLIIDLYSMDMSKADWRRIVQSAVRLLLYENKPHGLRHIFIEEAAEFAPQMMDREHGAVYAEIEKLVRMGGNAMLGVTLINQRAEQLNKAVLELCDCLFLHRQKGSRSIQALEKWLSFSGGDSKAITRTLPTLEQGQCYLWAGGVDSPALVQIPKKRTLHPNRREAFDEGKPCDVGDLVGAFPKTVIDGPQKPEPKQKTLIPPLKAPVERVAVFGTGEIAKLDMVVKQLAGMRDDMQTMLAQTQRALDEATAALTRAEALCGGTVIVQTDKPGTTLDLRRPPSQHWPKTVAKPATTTEGFEPGKGHRKILAILAGHSPRRLSQGPLGALTAFTPSTLRTYLPPLLGAGMIDSDGYAYAITRLGLDTIGAEIERPPTDPASLLAFWKQKFGKGEAECLHVLAQAGAQGLTVKGVAANTGFTESTARTYVPRLVAAGIVDHRADGYFISEELIP